MGDYDRWLLRRYRTLGKTVQKRLDELDTATDPLEFELRERSIREDFQELDEFLRLFRRHKNFPERVGKAVDAARENLERHGELDIGAEIGRLERLEGAVASTANFYDLSNIPQLVNYITDSGNDIGIWRSTINGIAALRSLVSDGTVSIALTDGGNAVELAVGALPVERLVGVLPPDHGGTGLGQSQIPTVGKTGPFPAPTLNQF